MSWIIRVAGVLLLVALVAAGAASFIETSQAIDDNRMALAARQVSFAPLPPINPAARTSILDRSPFIEGHSGFDRQATMTPPPPPIDVRLTGIVKLGKQLRANLRVGDQSILVKKGDETPVGKVTSIESSAIVIEGATTRRLEMFNP